MKYLLLFFIFLVTWNASAEEIFPAGCTPFTVSSDPVKLSATKPAVVMMHNLSEVDLWITHPLDEASASAGWSSRLQAGNWSALALNSENFVISCIESRPGHEQQIPCADVLAVCQWSDVTMPEKMSGTFWAGEDRLMLPLIAYIERRGFKLKTHKNDGE